MQPFTLLFAALLIILAIAGLDLWRDATKRLPDNRHRGGCPCDGCRKRNGRAKRRDAKAPSPTGSRPWHMDSRGGH